MSISKVNHTKYKLCSDTKSHQKQLVLRDSKAPISKLNGHKKVITSNKFTCKHRISIYSPMKTVHFETYY